MPGGVVQLARHSRAPILPVTTVAAGSCSSASIEPRLVLQPGGTVEEDTAQVLRHRTADPRSSGSVESWHQRRWKYFPWRPRE